VAVVIIRGVLPKILTINEQENLQHEEREKRRSTQCNGDELHRRASVSSQRPKDLIAEINT
ncbi:7343_t:CDS:2, partial [Funneliformis caledonium]